MGSTGRVLATVGLELFVRSHWLFSQFKFNVKYLDDFPQKAYSRAEYIYLHLIEPFMGVEHVALCCAVEDVECRFYPAILLSDENSKEISKKAKGRQTIRCAQHTLHNWNEGLDADSHNQG